MNSEHRRAQARLRRRQRTFRDRFLEDLGRLSEVDLWSRLSQGFAEMLTQEAALDPFWINTNRYLLALYNVFSALGFQIFAGPFPRVSGVQEEYRVPLLAFHTSRAVLLDDRPSFLFADIADIQPLCPVPILGLAYNDMIHAPHRGRRLISDYPARSLQDGRKMAGALAIGHVALSYEDLRATLILNPSDHANELRVIAARTGITLVPQTSD